MERSFPSIGSVLARLAGRLKAVLRPLAGKPEPEAPPSVSLPEGAVADPLAKFWSEFDAFIAEYAEAPRALEDLRRVLAEVRAQEPPRTAPGPSRTTSRAQIVNLRAMLREFRRVPTPGTDPLREYLEGLQGAPVLPGMPWRDEGSRAP